MTAALDPTAPRTARRELPGWLVTSLRVLITLALPGVLVLTAVRLVMSEPFVRLEYARPGFPADRYGFSEQDRLHYAPYAVRYLLNDSDISYLGDLTFADGMPLYSARELQHMEDVKTVTRAAFRIDTVLSLILLVGVVALGWRRRTRRALRRALSDGGVFTIALIVTLTVLILANWDYFFDTFHELFFQGDSWLFSNSDSLIRLFPEQFWFDAALTIGFLTVLGALAAIGGAFYWERHSGANQNGDPQVPIEQTDLSEQNS
jgi:integral membrane protein (TIGR01906 family)